MRVINAQRIIPFGVLSVRNFRSSWRTVFQTPISPWADSASLELAVLEVAFKPDTRSLLKNLTIRNAVGRVLGAFYYVAYLTSESPGLELELSRPRITLTSAFGINTQAASTPLCQSLAFGRSRLFSTSIASSIHQPGVCIMPASQPTSSQHITPDEGNSRPFFLVLIFDPGRWKLSRSLL
jgi:hypothetical protein